MSVLCNLIGTRHAPTIVANWQDAKNRELSYEAHDSGSHGLQMSLRDLRRCHCEQSAAISFCLRVNSAKQSIFFTAHHISPATGDSSLQLIPLSYVLSVHGCFFKKQKTRLLPSARNDGKKTPRKNRIKRFFQLRL
jgi:hypothetical protein